MTRTSPGRRPSSDHSDRARDLEATFDHGPLVATVSGPVGRVRLARPLKRNAINAQMSEAFDAVCAEFEARGVTVCALTAEGAVFCAGADLSELPHTGGEPPAEAFVATLRASPFLWVCGLHGGAVGSGVAVALSCPLVIASDEAWLWLPELSKLGALPVAVIDQLAPLIGVRAAVGLAAGERRVEAGEALEAGWITELVPAARLSAAVDEQLKRLAEADGPSLRATARRWSAVSGSLGAAPG